MASVWLLAGKADLVSPFADAAATMSQCLMHDSTDSYVSMCSSCAIPAIQAMAATAAAGSTSEYQCCWNLLVDSCLGGG